jgi:hypothetical protein
MAGSDRFCLRSCALVVVGSFRKEVVEALVPISRLLGVDGPKDDVEEGVVGVGMLVTDDVAECPKREAGRRTRWTMGPPLSDTGSREVE